MDNVEEDLTCSVCYSLFADPRVLPCSHTFCKSCLDNLLQVSNNYSIWRPLRLPLKCPNCRGVVELPPAGIDALPSNVSLKAIVEKYQSDSGARPPACPEHLRQPLNMYCIEDRQLICGLCLTVGEHQGHQIDDLQAAFIREKRTPSILLARLSERTWTEVCDLGEQLEQEKARCEALLWQDRQDVLHFFQTLEALLARKKQACLGALDKAGADVMQAYDPLIHRVKDIQEEQLDLVSLGSAVEEEDSPLVFLEKVHMFQERVEDFTNTPLPSVIKLSLTPRVAQFLQEHWPSVTVGALEEAPVPKVRCCTRCGGGEAVEKRSEGGAQQSRELSANVRGMLYSMVLTTLLVVGDWLGFGLTSQLSQALHGFSTELYASIWVAAGWTYAAMENYQSQVSSAWEKVSQLLAEWFQL